jgi:hypothetical protein
MKSATIPLTLVLLVTLSSISLDAQIDEHGRWVNGLSEPWFFESLTYTKEEAITAQTRWWLIQDEINRDSSNEWAGTYTMSTGEVSEAYLRWSPSSGFVTMDVHTCMPDVTGLNYGGAFFSPTLLQLKPEVPDRLSKSHNGHMSHAHNTFETDYIPVKWGERHYLVPKRHVDAFYRYVAGFREYQPYSAILGRGFFLKNDDYEKMVEGMPVLPPGYEHLVREPIDAVITGVGKKTIKRRGGHGGSPYYESVTPVLLNAGRANRVKQGMRLYVVGSKWMETAQITQVGKYTSRGVIIRPLDNNLKESYTDWDTGNEGFYPDVVVGWKLTTSWHKSEHP